MPAKTTPARKKAQPGRPQLKSAGDAQGNIVQTACLHFSRHGIKGSNNRDIASEAGVTPAMIHYYFKKKEELHLAVLQAAFAPLAAGMSALTSLEEWVHYFHAHLCSRPWLPHLMIREVLPANGMLRPLFLKQIAPQLFSVIRSLVADEARKRKVRRNFDVDRHVVLLMGMMVYPFMALQIAQDLTGRTFDTTMLEGFRDDALKLFLQGITAK
ncbi:MAG: TetR/AcrR family transcriptional regulator [Pseudomonadota bacterium]